MATVTIRNLPDSVKTRLSVQAAEAGVSLEEHLRRTLAQASMDLEPETGGESPLEIVQRLFGPGQGLKGGELELPDRKATDRPPIDFGSE